MKEQTGISLKIKENEIAVNNYSVSIRFYIPENYTKTLIIANGSGANMDSVFIKNYSRNIAQQGIMTVNFNFHYQEIGRKFPDKNEKSQETYIAVYKHVANKITEDKIIIGGKSMGGRIATQIAPQLNCEKIIIFGYPLHPPGRPDKLRDEHLYTIKQNVFFIQGENDPFGTKSKLEPVIFKMKNARSYFIPFGNHSLTVPKKSGLDNKVIETKIFETIVGFSNE